MQLMLPVNISDTLLCDLLVTAVEGGSNYWAAFRDVVRDEQLNIISCKVREQEPSGDAAKLVTVTPESLAHGLVLLSQADFPNAKPALARVLGEDWDANDADLVLQLTVLGEVIYG